MSRKTRKLIWSAPLMALLAVAGVLAVYVALTPGALFADGLPGTPTGLTVKADGRTAIDLSWTAPIDGGSVDGYRIDRSTDGHTWFAHKGKTMDDLITGTSDKDTELDPGKDYIYRVFAVNSHGVGPTSDDAGTTTKPVTAPGLVRNLQATDGRYPTKIVVTWQAPTDNGGKPITAYYVNYPAADGTWPIDIDDEGLAGVEKVSVTTDVCDTSGGQTSNDTITWTHTALLADVEHSYRVYASNGTVQTASDTEVGSTGNAITPSPITGFSVQKSVVTADTVHLYWIDPASNGGQEIDRYLLHISKTNRHWPTFNAQLSTAIATDIASVNTVAAEIDVPSSQTEAFEYEHDIPSGLEGTWYYRVYTETLDDSGTVPLRSVRAEGRVNFDAILPQLPTNLMATAASHTQIDLTWTATEWDNDSGLTSPIMPESDRRSPTGYRVDVSANADVMDNGIKWTRMLEDNTNLALPKFSHANGVERGKSYRYRIFPIFSSRLGPAVHTTSDAMAANPTAPGNVRNLAATESGAGQIMVTWQMPEDNGGAPITGYQVQTSTNQEMWDNKATRLPCQLSYTDKGLAAETTLYYRVIARNSVNATTDYTMVSNDPDNIVSRSAKTTGADLPPAPVGLTVEAAKDSTIQSHGDRGVLVYWNAADDPDGAPIENYRVERRVKPDTASPWGEWEWVQTCLATAGTLLYTHCTDPDEPDYDGGEERMYKVAAQNAAGIGTFTDAVTTPRPAADHTHPPTTADTLTKPSNVMATVSVTDTGAITVRWTPGENAPGGHLVLLFNNDFTEVPHVGTPTEEGMYTIPDVTTAGDYVVVVVSVKSRSEYLYDYARVNVP